MSRIVKESGKQFDPLVVASLKKKLQLMIEVKKMISDELEGIHDLDFTSDSVGAAKDDAQTGSDVGRV